MSKYDPLWEYMKKEQAQMLELSFDEIKAILGFAIDHSFLNYKKELLDYGFSVKKIFLKEKKVVFEKYELKK